MRSKLVKLLLVYFVTAIMIMTMPISLAGQDYIEDFEDDILSQQAEDDYYGAVFFETSALTAEAYVDNTEAYSGSKSYWLGDNGRACLWNVSFSDLGNITFYVKRTGASSGTGLYMAFNNSTGATIIRLRATNDGTGQYLWYYQEYDDDWILIYNDNENGEWCYAGFNITAVDNITYFWKTYSKSGSAPRTVCTNLSDTVITQVYIYTATANPDFWFDDIEFTEYAAVEDEGESSIPPCCAICTTVGIVGVTGGEAWGLITGGNRYSILHYRYDVPITGDFNRVDLQINTDMATALEAAGYEYSVEGKINGVYIGHNDEFVDIGDFYRLSWVNLGTYNVSNDNVNILFRVPSDFDYENDNGDTVCWSVSTTSYDLNNDGERFFQFFTDTAYGTWYFGEAYDYDMPGNLPNYNDLVLRFCYEYSEDWEINNDMQNNIVLTPEEGMCTNTGVRIDWFLNATAMLSDAKYLVISTGGSEIENITIYDQDWFVVFTPTSQGTYYVNITVDGSNAYSTSFVVACDATNYIWTDPNPSFAGQVFDIHYNYTFNYPGRIYISGTDLYQDVEAGANGTWSVRLNFGGTYIIQMYQYQSNAWLHIPGVDHEHYVTSINSDYIEVDPHTIEVEDCTTISGYHSHVGANVWVVVGRSFIQNGQVGDSETFEVEYCPEKPGIYNVELVFVSGNERITLYTSDYQLTVTGEGQLGDETQWIDLVGDYAAYLGVGIIVIFLVIPMGLASYYYVDIPLLVYVAFGSAGVGLAVALGLIGMYWVLLMLVALVTGAIITMFR